MPRDPLTPPDPPVEYAYDRIPEPDSAIEIRPGLLWLRYPLPFQLDHVNVWALDDGDGWVLIDTGFGDKPTRDLWRAMLAGPLGGRPIKRVIVTHMHPDHAGLAGWLIGETGAALSMSQGDYLLARTNVAEEAGRLADGLTRFYHRAGCGPAFIDQLAGRGGLYQSWVTPLPTAYTRLRHGDTIEVGGRRFRVIEGEGHSVEHLSFYCHEERLLIAGDQVLPRISPNVAVWAVEPEADPLTLFLGSLDRFRDLPADTLVLPSHNLPFHGLPDRLDQLAHHHDDRLAAILEALATPRTGAEVAGILFDRDLDNHQMFFAVGEALAHAHRLVTMGAAVAETDATGVMRFRRV